MLIIPLLCSCEFFNLKKEEFTTENDIKEVKLARVKEEVLYLSDLGDIFPEGASSTDSAELIRRFINVWVKNKTIEYNAKNQLDVNVDEIERKVSEYRSALLEHAFKKSYIANNLKREISEKEVAEYYEKNKSSFILKDHIVKAIFLKVPKEAPRQKKLLKRLKRFNQKDREEIQSYALRFASKYQLEDSLWLNFNELSTHTPYATLDNTVNYLKITKVDKKEDQINNYYLRILDYKITDELPPLEFVKEEIETIIINKRKQQLVRKLENEIIENAKSSNSIEIYY